MVTLTPPVVFQLLLVVLLNLALLVVLAGWSDLSSLSLCITSAVPFSISLAFGIGMASSLNTAMLLQGLVFWLQWRKKESKDQVGRSLGDEKMNGWQISRPVVVEEGRIGTAVKAGTRVQVREESERS